MAERTIQAKNEKSEMPDWFKFTPEQLAYINSTPKLGKIENHTVGGCMLCLAHGRKCDYPNYAMDSKNCPVRQKKHF
jgi:hypothetical protein